MLIGQAALASSALAMHDVASASPKPIAAPSALDTVTLATPVVEQPAAINSTFLLVSGGDFQQFMTNLLLPVELRGRSRVIWLDNKTAGALKLASFGQLSLRSERTGEQFNAAITMSDTLARLIIDPAVPFALTVHPDKLPPGKYLGQLPMYFAGRTPSPLVATFTVNVRDGWLLPVILLIAGIGVGRLTRLMQLPLSLMQDRLLVRLSYLSGMTNAFEPRVATYLRIELERIRRKVEIASTEAEGPVIEQLLSGIQSDLELFQSVEALKRSIASGSPADQKALIRRADDIATLVVQGKRLDAEAAATQLQRDITAAPAATMGMTGPAIVAAARSLTPSATPTLLQKLKSAHWRNRRLKPLLYYVLVFLLLIVGVFTVYVNEPLFGSQGAYDYVKCFLWGLGADVAAKTIPTLGLPKLA